MRLGGIDICEPLPDLKTPHALVILRPWIDAGHIGTLVISRLAAYLKAKDLGRLARPGNFFDFTRYRPTIHLKEGYREVVIPNSIITYAKREEGNDFIFLNLLEPHMFGELYVNSVLQLLTTFRVQRYCLLGSMYDLIPHTRPPLVTGGAIGKQAIEDFRRVGGQTSNYEGPTTIAYLISQKASQLGIETMTLLLHVPQYTQLDEDYMGQLTLLKLLCTLYSLRVDETDIEKAKEQRKKIDIAVDENPHIREIVAQLEAHYDARIKTGKEIEIPRLSPEIERFLKEMEKRFDER